MATDLDEIKERIAHARARIADVSRACREFREQHVRVQQAIDPLTGRFEVSLQVVRAVPTSIKSEAGMVANELRACLDALACQLAIRNAKSVSGVYFPISKSKSIFDDDGENKIKKLSEQDKQIIRDLEPYRGGHPVLFALHEADRTRKHQRLVLHTAQSQGMAIGGMLFPNAGSFSMVNCQINGFNVSRLHYGAEAMTPPVPGGPPVVVASGFGTAPVAPVIEVAYAEPAEIAGRPIPLVLDRFAAATHDVVSRFD